MVEKFREAFHLDEPLYVQYLYFYGDLFSGKTISWKDSQPVLKKIWERFLNSLPLFIVGTILTWTISFPVGIRSALFRGGIYDRSSTFFAYLLISIPGFFFAYILIAAFPFGCDRRHCRAFPLCSQPDAGSRRPGLCPHSQSQGAGTRSGAL
jgi:ABC-type dipeptide/oligopeptide/nickel transport system permease component